MKLSLPPRQGKMALMFTHRFLFGLAVVTVLGISFPRCLAGQQQTQEAASNGYAELDDASARKLVKGCSLPHEVSGPGAPGSQIVLQFTVSEKGKLLGVHTSGTGCVHASAQRRFRELPFCSLQSQRHTNSFSGQHHYRSQVIDMHKRRHVLFRR